MKAENSGNLCKNMPFIYNSNSKPGDIKSLCSSAQTLAHGRSVTNDVTRGSYASVLKADQNKLWCHDTSTKLIPGTTTNFDNQDSANKQGNDSFKSSHVSGPKCDGLQETEHLIMNHVGDNSLDGGPVIFDLNIADNNDGGHPQ